MPAFRWRRSSRSNAANSARHSSGSRDVEVHVRAARRLGGAGAELVVARRAASPSAPASASALAVARPMPDAAPVTTAVFPLKSVTARDLIGLRLRVQRVRAHQIARGRVNLVTRTAGWNSVGSASGVASCGTARRARRRDAAAELEALGYTAVWIPDVGRRRVRRAPRPPRRHQHLVAATGILNLWMHSAAEVGEGFAALEADHPGRTLLGIGVSHRSSSTSPTPASTPSR